MSSLSSEPAGPVLSTDLFWQSVAKSVFLSQSDSWLTSSGDTVYNEQINGHDNGGLSDVLPQVDCESVDTFTHSHSELLANISNSCSSLTYGQGVECRDQTAAGHCNTNAYASSFDVACIDRDVCLMIGYKPMSVDIFNRLRQTFGCSECEFCGRLFFVQSDLDKHMDIHTGL